MSKRDKIASCIYSHAWNPDRTQLAAAVGKNLVIYDTSDPKPRLWKKLHNLADHDMDISGVDWSQSNKIVTCSHDRNAFVWTYEKEKDTWRPKLVVVRIDRAANAVSWSPKGDKFAVASSAKKVPICHFEEDQNWWISTMIKKHKSTVNCVAWHPNNQLIATGACDFRCRVFCAFMDSVDEEQDNGPLGDDEDYDFGDVMAEFGCKGWIQAVAWSPNGNMLAFAGHDSSLTVVEFKDGEISQQTMNNSDLPFLSLIFVTDDRILAAGYDFTPFVFDKKDDFWEIEGDIDNYDQEESTKGNDAFKFFHHKTAAGQSGETNKLKSKHDNTVTCIRSFATKGDVTTFSTTGHDGRIHKWDVPHKGGEG